MCQGLPGDIAQLGERLPCKQEVRSSILLVSTTGPAPVEHSPLYIENCIEKKTNREDMTDERRMLMVLHIRRYYITGEHWMLTREVFTLARLKAHRNV